MNFQVQKCKSIQNFLIVWKCDSVWYCWCECLKIDISYLVDERTVGHHEGLSCCDLETDPKLIITAAEKNIKVWDLRCSEKPIHSINYRQKVQSLQLLEDKTTILVATDDDDYDFYRTTSAWSLTTAKQIQTFDTTFSATYIRSFGDKMVVGAMDSSLELYSLKTGGFFVFSCHFSSTHFLNWLCTFS